jgi:pepF/M3 family oligoendopeptidase
MTWDMESIFEGGSKSPEFDKFRKRIADDLQSMQTTFASLPKAINAESRPAWAEFLNSMQGLIERLDHAESFASCLSAQDVNDDRANTILEEISSLGAKWQTIMTDVEEAATGTSDAEWEHLLNDGKLSGAKFFWNEMRARARDKMEPRLEKLAAELSVNGYHAWGRLYTKIAGDLRADFEIDGKRETLSMGQLANKMSNPDRKIRRQAFEKLEEAWKGVDSTAAMALNSQAGFRLDVYKNRDWSTALYEPLVLGRLKKETVDAMWSAVARGIPKVSEFVRIKKKMLGLDDFRWYDQIAPVGGGNLTYTYDEACDFVIKHLASFSPDLGDLAKTAIDNRWIEAEDRGGKAAGGFCTRLPLKKQSRIFMTFSGAYDEMMTLAHEIGHAYHSHVLRDLDYFARHYPMNLAETASTFNELLVTDAALAGTSDPKIRLSLLNQKLQDGMTMFCNIRARFLFDCSYYEERKKGSVPKDRLNELMVEAQKTAFGDILSDDGYHPLFWASKLHFFITEMPFYNFPYTFGYLFSGGIYDLAKKEGSDFYKRYRDLLADTGSMTTEDVAQKHLGIDLTQEKFWDDAVSRVLMDVEPFAEMAGKF